MVEGFAGFGFPKSHSAAFGLLAYQSTWLRVHYGPEFLCALLNEQPMGFYAPDSLVHEAENRGIEVLGLDVNASEVQCTVAGRAVCAWAWATSRTWPAAEVHALVAERERNGPFASLGELAGARGCRRGTLEQLAWSGACDSLIGARAGAGTLKGADRRAALWQLGVATPAAMGEAGKSTQLALPLELPPAPRLRPLGRWQRLIADYSTSGVTVGEHALAILRERLTVPSGATGPSPTDPSCSPPAPSSHACPRLPGGGGGAGDRQAAAGHRQGDDVPAVRGRVRHDQPDRPEGGLRAPPPAGASRAAAAGQRPPGALAGAVDMRAWSARDACRMKDGQDETAQERIRPVINVIVRELAPLERFLDGGVEGTEGVLTGARVHHLNAEVGSSMRAVAPPVQSFGVGRRR